MSSREGEWRALITTTNKLRSEKDNLPLYVQVENLLQLYYQNMFCREREVSKHWHLVKYFSNGCQGLLFHYGLTWSQKRWGQTLHLENHWVACYSTMELRNSPSSVPLNHYSTELRIFFIIHRIFSVKKGKSYQILPAVSWMGSCWATPRMHQNALAPLTHWKFEKQKQKGKRKVVEYKKKSISFKISKYLIRFTHIMHRMHNMNKTYYE